MTKYEPWRSLLQTLGADEIVVTFEQLGEVAPTEGRPYGSELVVE